MNKILNILKKKYENKVSIQNNINKLEFEIKFDDYLNEEEDISDDEDYLGFIKLNIKVLLLQKKNKNEYAISFIKKEGELYDFANRVMEIKKIIKNKLFK